MTDGPDVPGEWDPSGQAEPPAALLRRAISHVEQLLQRLERPGATLENGEGAAVTGTTGLPGSDINGGAAGIGVPFGTASGGSGASDPRAGGGGGSSVSAGYGGDDATAIEPVLANPVRRISSAAQAEALRVSLNAHEKANRLLAEASAIRAQSASEGEQILVEARELADRMQNEATEEAALFVQRAREEAENLVSQAAAEMQRVHDSSHEQAERVRSEAAAEAQRMLESAQFDATRLRTESEAEAQQVRELAYQEAERVRREAAGEAQQLRASAAEESERVRNEAAADARLVRESAKADTDGLRAEAEQLRESMQFEADRLLTASNEEAQRLRDAAQREAERVRSDAEQQARVDREAADAAIRELLTAATVEAEQIREDARRQGEADAEQHVAARVAGQVADARRELDVERVRVYEMLGTANASVGEVRSSLRELVDTLGRSMGSMNGATGTLDALMAQVRDAAAEGGVQIDGPPEPPQLSAPESSAESTGPIAVVDESQNASGGDPNVGYASDEGTYGSGEDDYPGEPAVGNHESGEQGEGEGDRRPLGQLFGASKSRATRR